MKKVCPWCNGALPPPADIPEETRAGKRVAVCPSCKNPIRMSRTELIYSAFACALLPVLVAKQWSKLAAAQQKHRETPVGCAIRILEWVTLLLIAASALDWLHVRL